MAYPCGLLEHPAQDRRPLFADVAVMGAFPGLGDAAGKGRHRNSIGRWSQSG